MNLENIELPSNRKFGVFFTALFFTAAAYFFYKSSTVMAWVLLSVCIILLIATITKPELLFPLNKAWMILGLMMGKIISPIILGIIFYLIFSPVALFLRLIGRDELMLKKKKTITYWQKRCANALEPNSFNNQF